VRDDDSEIVVFPHGRECPSGLNNIEGVIITDDQVTKHSGSTRSRSSRLAIRDPTTENKSTGRNFDGISQPPASFRREAADRMVNTIGCAVSVDRFQLIDMKRK
jgi:hypothetical protein